MSSTTALGQLRKHGYRAFYSLPGWLRRRLVRLAAEKYIIGAVALVRDSEATGAGRLLLLRQPPGLGWSLPAGLLKHGEQPVVGCARELYEESGIRVPTEALTPASPNTVVHTRGRWLDCVFEVSVAASEVTLRVDGGEVLEAEFHPLDRLPPLTPATANLLGYFGIGPYADHPEARR
jgi:ADP-ribose pyrophosphatase YjhB (NUDIX family)